MTAREIDALVGQHIFKLERIADPEFLPHHGWFHPDDPNGKSGPLDKGPRYGILPYYSTDPAASKDLRDRMRELGWHYTISSPIMDGGFMVQLIKLNGAFRPVWVRFPDGVLRDASTDQRCLVGKAIADDELMAVALAALRAMEVEV